MQKIRIDFDNPGLPQHISAVENDSQSRFFQATLYENGKAYTAPEGATYSIMYCGFGPQNQGWYDTINDGAGKRAACAVAGNVVTCEIARQALQVPGHVSIVLCVTTGKGYMLKSWPIECDCKNDRYDSTVEIQSFFYITQVSNADWNQAIQAWENLKDAIDPTLSVSGKAADAANVGEAVNAEAKRAKGVESQIKEDLDVIRIKYANLFKINPNIQDVSVSNGFGTVYVNENYIDVEEGKPYFVYVKFKITNLTNWVQGFVYTRLVYDVDAGGWEDTWLPSIKNDGEYLMCYNFTAKKSGKVGVQLYFDNQLPSTNTFSCQCTKLFVAQTSDNIKELVDSEEQVSDISKVILKTESVTWDNLTNDVKEKIERTSTDFTIIDCWGDSLTQGVGATNYPYPTKLQELIGSKYTVNNYGQGSEIAEVIAFRQGGMGAIVLPFTASANVSDYNNVTINSVDGASLETMSYSGKYYGNDMVYLNGKDKWKFRRGDNNSLNLVCADQSLLSKEYSRPTIAFSEGKGTGHIVIICIGQNGWAAQTSRPEALADIIQKMVEHNGTERYIVVGRPTGNKDERNVEEIILASRFSDHFVNARAYISEYGLSDNNLSPTQEDTEAMSSGAIPPQLRIDGVHMNDYGYISMANCIYNRGTALNYWH